MKTPCRTLAIALALAAAGSDTASGASSAESTLLTLASGLPRTPEQEATRIDEALLRFRIDPAKREIAGDATLTVRATRPLDRLVIDLDSRFRLEGIDVDGRPLKPARYRNPEGRLEVDLPKRLAADRPLALRIRYAGKPRVAPIAPWDGGFVWAKTPDGEPWIATAVAGRGLRPLLAVHRHPLAEPKRVDLHDHRAGAAVAAVQRRRRPDGPRRTAGARTTGARGSPNTYAHRAQHRPLRSAAGRLQEPLRQHDPAHYWHLRERRRRRRSGLFDGVRADARLLRERDRPLPVRRREDGRRRDAAPRHGAPDDQRLRQ